MQYSGLSIYAVRRTKLCRSKGNWMFYLIYLGILCELGGDIVPAFLHLKNIDYNRFLVVFRLYEQCFLHLKTIKKTIVG